MPRKKFNGALAIKIFLGLIAFDIGSIFLAQVFDGGVGETVLAVPFYIVNFPCLPFVYFSGGEGAIAYLAIGGPLFSALLWSVAAGFTFRVKTAGRQPLINQSEK